MHNWEKNYFNELLKKYNSGTASEEEIQFLESFYDMFEVNDELFAEENQQEYTSFKEQLKNNIDSRITRQNIKPVKVRSLKTLIVRFSAAAAILLFSVVGVYFFKQYDAKKNKQNATVTIVPGSNRALLTLANGKTIDLTDAADGILAKEANIQIKKNADGLLVYTITNVSAGYDKNGDMQQNTISTPNGGQYQVVLPDGSKVMLNAASSLTYPVVFAGTERVVQLKGEAYFEVVHNTKMPFKVTSNGQTVTVLGTHFNVNAYEDESVVKTTLLQGSVMVATAKRSITITPGEQATMLHSGEQLGKQRVDTYKETAWKNGVFSFDGDNVKTVMRQVARWYNVAVVFNGNFNDDKFYGEISRSSSLNDVIKILKLSNVDFEVQGRQIIISEAK